MIRFEPSLPRSFRAAGLRSPLTTLPGPPPAPASPRPLEPSRQGSTAGSSSGLTPLAGSNQVQAWTSPSFAQGTSVGPRAEMLAPASPWKTIDDW